MNIRIFPFWTGKMEFTSSGWLWGLAFGKGINNFEIGIFFLHICINRCISLKENNTIIPYEWTSVDAYNLEQNGRPIASFSHSRFEKRYSIEINRRCSVFIQNPECDSLRCMYQKENTTSGIRNLRWEIIVKYSPRTAYLLLSHGKLSCERKYCDCQCNRHRLLCAYAKSTVSREILAKTLPEHTVYQCEVTETLLKGQDDLFRSNRLTLSLTELLTRLLHYNFTLFLAFSSLCLSFFFLAFFFFFIR